MPFMLREKLCSQHLNANGIGIASEMNRCPPNQSLISGLSLSHLVMEDGLK